MSRSKLSRSRANGRCGSRGLAITGGGRQGGSTQVRSRGLRCLHTRLPIVLSGRAGPYTSIGSGLLLLLLLLFLLHLLLQLRLLLPKLRLLLQCHEKLLGLDELWIVGRSVVRFQLLKSLYIVCQQRLSPTARPGGPCHGQTHIVHVLDLLLRQVGRKAGAREVLPRGRRRLYGSHGSGSERVGLKGLRKMFCHEDRVLC